MPPPWTPASVLQAPPVVALPESQESLPAPPAPLPWSFEGSMAKDVMVRREGYDCSGWSLGLSLEELRWTQTQQVWCCQEERVGCTAQPEACMLDGPVLGAEWARRKQAQCCRHWDATDIFPPDSQEACCEAAGVGCKVARDNGGSRGEECQETGMDSSSSWTDEKRDWCCRNGFHCSEAPRPLPREPDYNCDGTMDEWEWRWSQAQLKWCCEHQSVGCREGVKLLEKFPVLPEVPTPYGARFLATAATGGFASVVLLLAGVAVFRATGRAGGGYTSLAAPEDGGGASAPMGYAPLIPGTEAEAGP